MVPWFSSVPRRSNGAIVGGPAPSGVSHRIHPEERTTQYWHRYLPEGRPGLQLGAGAGLTVK